MKYKFSKLFILICIAVFLAGCMSTKQYVPKSSGDVPVDKARIVLKRDIVTTDFGFVIMDNETEIGMLEPGGELEWDRPAGPMKLTAMLYDYFSGKIEMKYPAPTVNIEVGTGRKYEFVLHWGWDERYPGLSLVSETPVAPSQKKE